MGKTQAQIVSNPEIAARLRLAITRLARVMRQHGGAGLTPSQLSALATIEDLGPIRMSELAAKENVSAPVATRVIASLQELGYIERIKDGSDGRACLIDLSKEGQRFAKRLWGERTAGLSLRIQNLSTDDLERLQDALPVLESLSHETQLRSCD